MKYKNEIIDRLRKEIRRESGYKPAPLPTSDKIISENEKLIQELKNVSDGLVNRIYLMGYRDGETDE